MWQSLYDSSWHHPVTFWILQALLLVALAVRPPRAPRVLALLVGGTALAALDAWLTQPASVVPKTWQANVGLIFVILGDWRYWFVRALGPERRWRPAALRSLGLALIVPVAMIVPQLLGVTGRPLYLLYECSAFALALGVAMVTRRQLSLAAFWLVMYGLWIVADLLILAGLDLGFAVRLVPNALYYGGFWTLVYGRLRDQP